jgi:hypothetical protein
MAPQSLAEIVLDRTMLITELLKGLRVESTGTNIQALLAINTANEQMKELAVRRATASDVQRSRRQQEETAKDILLPTQARRG